MAGPKPLETKYLHRTLMVALASSILFGLIAGRLYVLQMLRHDFYLDKAKKQQLMTVKIDPQRGVIYSANGYPLAASMFRKSAYFAPEFLRAAPFVKKSEEIDPKLYAQIALGLARTLYGDEEEEEGGDLANSSDLDTNLLVQKKAKEFEKKMRLNSRLVLRGEAGDGSEIKFSGEVSTLGWAQLKGPVDGTTLTLRGRIQLGKAVELSAKIRGKEDILLLGKASSSSERRTVTVSGGLGGHGAVELTGAISRRKDFILRRKIPDAKVLEVISLREQYGLPLHALHFRKEGKREYPNGSLAAHVTGFTIPDDLGDNKGVEGVERQYNQELSGSPSKDVVEVTIRRQNISPVAESALTSATGNNIYLTINKAIQKTAEDALALQVEEFQAQGGVCVVMEVKTGAILAMASNPTFDLSDRSVIGRGAIRNRCVADAIPTGSVMKIFTAATLLERNKMNPNELIDCQGGVFYFPNGTRKGRRIRDSHDIDIVPVHTAFAKSSNIGFVELGLRLEKEEIHEQFSRFGFGFRTGIDLPGESKGVLHPVGSWKMDSRISVPIGYEILVTPIQIAAAVAAIANDGKYMEPHVLKEIRSPKNELVRRFEPHEVRRVCSPQTSRIMLDLMEEVVTDGTGKDRAELPNHRTGGKTGTTIKTDAPRPEQDPSEARYIASFVGLVPIEEPEIVIYSWIDEPQGKNHFGGDVAAPIFQMVAGEAVRLLQIEPSQMASREAGETEIREPEDSVPSRKPALPGLSRHVFDGLMPDLTGLTVREVAEKMNRLHIDAQMHGNGVVIRQQPPPGDPLPVDTRGFVVFGPPYSD